ncbi:hypothetical protein LH128_14032 [Sphingomonas sp. LH128]|uniref:hypothetical protein n=1 Tax=Sphingomonas sp. LH128 TaxID=473781 RepID=UPI00027C9764|nr:hypothetical protein [Sphingomonas sp. LH128]EJU12394.1 hypothetical protein LH128_14032 [Sphingomonas sp. LH128]
MGKFEIEAAVEVLADDFAKGLAGLVSGDWLREGVLKEGVNTLVWAIYREMPDQRPALAEAMENWPDLIKEAMADDDGIKEGSKTA